MNIGLHLKIFKMSNCDSFSYFVAQSLEAAGSASASAVRRDLADPPGAECHGAASESAPWPAAEPYACHSWTGWSFGGTQNCDWSPPRRSTRNLRETQKRLLKRKCGVNRKSGCCCCCCCIISWLILNNYFELLQKYMSLFTSAAVTPD